MSPQLPTSRRLLPLLTLLVCIAALVAPSHAEPLDDGTADHPTTATAMGSAHDEAWPQWRGPFRDGRSVGDPWPETLDGLKQAWSLDGLGPSYSGPIVTADRVFITETQGGDTEVVHALDRATGKSLWKASWPGKGSVPPFARANGDWIRSTPSFDGETLFVGGINEVLVAIDAGTGEIRWTKDFPKIYGTVIPPFGFASSPLVLGPHLFIQAANSLVKLDKATGRVIWRNLEETGGMTNQGAFSSPIKTTLNGVEQLLVQTRTRLHGVDLETGTSLWSQEVPSFRGCNILTPTIFNNGIFTSGLRNGSRFYSIEAGDQEPRVREAWTGKASGYMSSPVVIDDHVYLHLANGRLTALDLNTGESRWTSTPFGKYWSMVTRDDKILALDERGDLILVRANPEKLEVLAEREVAEDEAWAYLAVSGDQLFVRDLGSIQVFDWSANSPAEQTTAP